jgi:hypothetical protein
MDSSALTQRITQLSLPALSGLATALEMARLYLPVQPAAIAHYVPSPQIEQTTEALNALHQQGMTAPQVALMLRLLITERRSAQIQRNQVELVWTGLETPGMESRDTQVVVQEMFSRAEQSVLISTYAIDQDQKAQTLFDGLAQKMDRLPQLNVQSMSRCSSTFSDPTAIALKKRSCSRPLLANFVKISGMESGYPSCSTIRDRSPPNQEQKPVSMPSV